MFCFFAIIPLLPSSYETAYGVEELVYDQAHDPHQTSGQSSVQLWGLKSHIFHMIWSGLDDHSIHLLVQIMLTILRISFCFRHQFLLYICPQCAGTQNVGVSQN